MENLFDPNVGILELAAQKLEPLLSEIVFVGGSAIGLLITDVAASPIRVTILGFGNDWYEPAIKNAKNAVLPSGKRIKLITAPYFLMTKLEAFEGRGKGDFQMSHDIEDIIVVIDGRPELIKEVLLCDEKLRYALSNKFTGLLSNKKFVESIFGHMPPDEVSQKRVTKVIDRIRNIAVQN